MDLSRAAPLLKTDHLAQAQAFIGAQGAGKAGESARFAADVSPGKGADARERERARIAASVGAASGRTNQLKLILRKGFEAFGELTDEDMVRVAALAELPWGGAELAELAVEQGLAGRSKGGALIPLREGR